MTAHNYTIYQPPPPAGAWVIGGTLHVHTTKRPRRLTRWICRLLLEWEWRDAAGVTASDPLDKLRRCSLGCFDYGQCKATMHGKPGECASGVAIPLEGKSND